MKSCPAKIFKVVTLLFSMGISRVILKKDGTIIVDVDVRDGLSVERAYRSLEIAYESGMITGVQRGYFYDVLARDKESNKIREP